MTKRIRELGLICGAVLGLCWASTADAQATSSFHHWQARTTAIGLLFDADSDVLDLDIVDTADFAFDISYFFTPNIAVQVLATYVNVQVESAGNNLGAVDLLPPIVTAQYHFTQMKNQGVEPYVGVGFNYNHFGNESGGVRAAGVHVDDTFGFVAELGMDVATAVPGLYLNGNFKYLKAKPDIKANAGGKVDELDINAYIIGAGVGYRFF